MKSTFETIRMACTAKLGGGIPALFLSYLLKIVYFIPILFIWRSLAESGADLGSFTLPQLLTYTCVGTLLGSQLNVRSPAASWHYEGLIIDLYSRPQTIFGQLIMQTIGGWIPELLLFVLPTACILPFLGINLLPVTFWFFPCLLLSISLGFAVDFIFTCFIIRMQSASWLAIVIRSAVTSLLSGAVIPLSLLPWNLGEVFRLLPFGSLAGAPLAVYVGTAEPLSAIIIQIFWNFILWPLAFLIFRSSRERMVSYGG